MPARISILGRTFGKLKVVEELILPNGNLAPKVRCLCECGKEKLIGRGNLMAGAIVSCDCVRIAALGTHHHARRGPGGKTKTYIAWKNMIRRCTNPKGPEYHCYGGRGIKVCQQWHSSFEQFLKDVGEIPKGYSLDRINNNGNYEPGNIRIATRMQQAHNTQKNRNLTVNGITAPISELCRRFKINRSCVEYRLQKGWPIEYAFTEPSHSGKTRQFTGLVDTPMNMK